MGTAKRIRKGEYKYRGYKILCHGYYEPEQRVVWEGIDEDTGGAVAHGYTKKDIMIAIDNFSDNS
jgi:hypothetical protein